MDERYNILMIMADQFRMTTLESMGDGISTPNIKRIMEKGMVFEKAACTCPLCTPSRASLATGKLPNRCGVPVHDGILPLEQETYYQKLRDAGYRVGVVGKTDLHKADKYIGTKGNLPSMYQYGFTDPFELEGKMNAARYSVNSDGTKNLNGPYQKHLESKGLMETLNTDYKTYMRELPRYYAAPSVLPDEDFEDAFIGRAACEWLQEVEDDVPWHYFVSFVGPHNPWDPPKEDYDFYEDHKFWESIKDDFYGKPEWVKKRAQRETGGMTREDEERMKRCYAGSVRVIDRYIGKILDVLEERGLKERTIIIFCADHGEMLGDHGLLEKKVMYESSLRIPMVIQAPWMKERKNMDSLVMLMDLAPTCMEIAGVPCDSRKMDARSLMPILRGETQKSEHLVQISELINCQMISDGKYKWIRNWNDKDELYDLDNDRAEIHNIIDELPEVIEKLQTYTFRQ